MMVTRDNYPNIYIYILIYVYYLVTICIYICVCMCVYIHVLVIIVYIEPWFVNLFNLPGIWTVTFSLWIHLS